MNADDLPLIELFEKLRDNGLTLVIDDYHLLVRALHGGFGLSDFNALGRLCCNLWVKSEQEKRIFYRCFDEVIALIPAELPGAEKTESRESETEVIAAAETATEGENLEGDFSGDRSFTSNPIEVEDLTVNNNSNTSRVIDLFINLWQQGEIREKTEFKKSESKLDLRQLFEKIAPGEGSPETTFDSLAKWILETEDEEETVAKSMQQSGEGNWGMSDSSFIFKSEYFPVTKRQMKQSWRFLRRPIREGPPTELDIRATVQRAGREGVMLAPVLVSRRVNRTKLVLLIDWEGSMVPFHALSQRLAETALRGGRLEKPDLYYFHNCPVEYVYTGPNSPETREVRDIFAKIKEDRGAVLIFSDAGAARGGDNEERVRLTEEFLEVVGERVRCVAWINPMPRSRWEGTTAEKVAELLPMFEITRRGLQGAIDVLRGRVV